MKKDSENRETKFRVPNETKCSEKRMYVLVCGSLAGINKGIQAMHAGIAYAEYLNNQVIISEPKKLSNNYLKYKDWVSNWKTIIILNGGTTGNGSTMKKYATDLRKMNVVMKAFKEPDLNDAVTAIAFVLDLEEDSHVVGYLKTMGLA